MKTDLRQKAVLAGEKRYFTGQPCKYGHISARFTTTKTCCECNAARNATPQLREFRKRYYAEQYAKNREEILARGTAYNKTPVGRDSTVTRSARRRALKASAEGNYAPRDIAALRAAQGDQCVYCGAPLMGRGSVDHILALSKGGTNWPNNLQLVCRSCNSRKHTKDASAFAREVRING